MVDIKASSSRKASSRASSIIPISSASEDEDPEEKIIKETENKISKSSASGQFEGSPFFSAESLQKRLWRSVVYAFYEERPKVIRKNNKKGVKSTYLAFSCVKCAKTYFRGTGSDSGSTGAMRDHIPQCWGEDIWNNAKDLELEPAKEIIRKSRTMKNVKLTEMLGRLPGSKETFSLSPPSREETRVAIARWVSESMRPFHIVKDRGLRWLCKTGRPHFYLPDETTVAKDVKFLHSWAERQLAEILQVKVLNNAPLFDLTCLGTELRRFPRIPG
jgi:hypothetical protein